VTVTIAALPPLAPALPEIVLAVGAMALLMLGVFGGDRRGSTLVDVLAIALLVAAACLVWFMPGGRVGSFGDSFVLDGFARFLKILTLLGSAVAIAMSLDYLAAERQQRFEYAILIVLATLGMLMLISAGDLIALYLGFELMSLSLYVVAASNRDSLRSTEAGLKYFVLGALSSGMLLYGCSLVYGATGSIAFAAIAQAAPSAGMGLTIGLVFLFVGFCFKISAGRHR
jgi:NADH-quinone oxidoreductase subunit N